MTTVEVPATTTNLGPGFDALGVALCLYNRVSVERADAPAIEVHGEGARSVPRDHRNLVLKAITRWHAERGEAPAAWRIVLENRIPVGRGLGSSAAAIVGGLVAANLQAADPLPEERLLKIAVEMEGHPDNVTPALLGGFQTCCAADDRVLHLRLPAPPGLRAVLAIPERELSTEKARSVLPAFVPRRDAVFNVQRVSLLLAALFLNQPEYLGAAMEDRLHQPYRAELIPGFDAALAAAREAGAAGACLSGAGSTLLAFVAGEDRGVGQAMCEALAREGLRAETMTLAVDEQGARAVTGSAGEGG